jgi:hypothetical protein
MNTFYKLGTLFCLFLLVGKAYASPKVTQASSVNFKSLSVTVLAVEEFGKSPTLLILPDDKKETAAIQPIEFSEYKADDEFTYVNPFLRFKTFRIKGLVSPLMVAVVAQPTATDEIFEIKLISEKKGKITLLNPEPITITIQDGIYLGYINREYGYGMIVWNFQFDAAHYSSHKYDIRIYKWDSKEMQFTLNKKMTTKKKFSNGCSALKHHGLPCKNYRNEVIRVEEDMCTLGIESELLQAEQIENESSHNPYKAPACQETNDS